MSVSAITTGLTTANNAQSSNIQYPRYVQLLVSDANGNAVDLSLLRIKFSIKRNCSQTPNVADIKVFNLDNIGGVISNIIASYNKITGFVGDVTLKAGYVGNSGTIFKGNIKQIITGRDSGTDTFIEFLAGDGQLAYETATINCPIGNGSNQAYQLQQCLNSMSQYGITGNSMNTTNLNSNSKLSRGKVLYGNTRDFLNKIAATTRTSWSIQNGQIVFVAHQGYLPGQSLQINTTNGMIGTPQQTLNGVNVKCLLNPNIIVSTRIQLNTAQILQLPINLEGLAKKDGSNIPAPLQPNGEYYAAEVNHTGDTRGVEWYSDIVGQFIDPQAGAMNPVAVNYSKQN